MITEQPRASGASAPDVAELSSAKGAARDSASVAVWTVVSRVTGVVRVAAIGAVLGPTFFSNVFQFANTLPNLIFYTFLAGSLFSSLLVPALVGHLDGDDLPSARRTAGGFLGTTLLALLVVLPLAVAGGPLLLGVAGSGRAGAVPAGQILLLMVLLVPQVFLYAVVGTATAAMNAQRRFALAAAAPAFENVGVLLVLAVTGAVYGMTRDVVPDGEVLLLGIGSTSAVVLHAAAQWWGARRAGVVLIPRRGWTDPEVRVLLRRAVPSLAQASLFGLQVLVMLTVASRVPGGVVAFQVAMNFYALPIAVGATPVALALLPRLARLHQRGERGAYHETLLRGLSLALFVTVPASLGYLALAHPLASAVAVGRMGTPQGVALVAAALGGIAPAVCAQTVFLICTYESYARHDTRTPLRAMGLQAVTCLVVAAFALTLHGSAVLLCLGLGYSAAVILSATSLALKLRSRHPFGELRLAQSAARVVGAGLCMMLPAHFAAAAVQGELNGRTGSMLGLFAGVVVGGVIFLGLQVLARAPELSWVTGGTGRRGSALDGS